MIDDDKTHHIEAGSAVEALPPPKACLSQVWKYFLSQKLSFSIKILTVRLESSESTTRLPDAWWTSVVFFVNFVVFKERSRCWYFCQLPTSHCYVVVDLAVSVLTSSQMALAIVNWQCCLLVLNFSGSRRWRKVGEEVRGRGGYWDEEDDEEEEDEGGEEEKEEEVQLEASTASASSKQQQLAAGRWKFSRLVAPAGKPNQTAAQTFLKTSHQSPNPNFLESILVSSDGFL